MAIELNGTSDIVEVDIDSTVALNTQSSAFCLWTAPSSLTKEGKLLVVTDSTNATNNAHGIEVFDSGGSVYRFRTFSENGGISETPQTIPNITIVPGLTYRVLTTFNNGASVVQGWVNLVANAAPSLDNSPSPTDNISGFSLGGIRNTGGASEFMDGEFSEWSWWTSGVGGDARTELLDNSEAPDSVATVAAVGGNPLQYYTLTSTYQPTFGTAVATGPAFPAQSGPNITSVDAEPVEGVSLEATGTALDTIATDGLVFQGVNNAFSHIQTGAVPTGTTQLDFTSLTGVNDAAIGVPSDGIPFTANSLTSGTVVYTFEISTTDDVDTNTFPATINAPTNFTVFQSSVAAANTDDSQSIFGTGYFTAVEHMQVYVPTTADAVDITWAADGTFIRPADQTSTIEVIYFDPGTGEWSILNLTINATTVTGIAPVMPSDTSVNVNEGTISVGTYIADSGSEPITYTLGGADAADFSINDVTGAVVFLSAPDYDVDPIIYNITVIATNSTSNDSQAIIINVLEVSPIPTIQVWDTPSLLEAPLFTLTSA